MKLNLALYIIAVLLISSCSSKDDVLLFPAPEGVNSSNLFQVNINRQTAFVHQTRVFFELNNPDRTSSFVQFDLKGKAYDFYFKCSFLKFALIEKACSFTRL